MAADLPEPQFFATPAELRDWFAEHHATETELRLGYWKKATGRPSVTWAESVREALCVGWIDGRGGRIDDESHAIRFTPRRARSTWSNVNIKAFAELKAEGRVLPAGQAAYDARTEDNSGLYSHEATVEPKLDADQVVAFEAASPAGWTWFGEQAPSYRKAAIHWVTTAKKPETRERRLQQLIADSADRRRLKHLTSPGRR